MITVRECRHTVKMYTGLYELPERFAWTVYPRTNVPRVFTRPDRSRGVQRAKIVLKATLLSWGVALGVNPARKASLERIACILELFPVGFDCWSVVHNDKLGGKNVK